MAITHDDIIQNAIKSEKYLHRAFSTHPPVYEDDKVLMIAAQNPSKAMLLKISDGIQEHSKGFVAELKENINECVYVLKDRGIITAYMIFFKSKGKSGFAEDVYWIDNIYFSNTRQLKLLLQRLSLDSATGIETIEAAEEPRFVVYDCSIEDKKELRCFEDLGAKITTKSGIQFHLSVDLAELSDSESLKATESISKITDEGDELSALLTFAESKSRNDYHPLHEILVLDKEQLETLKNPPKIDLCFTDEAGDADDASTAQPASGAGAGGPITSPKALGYQELINDPHQIIKGGITFSISQSTLGKSIYIECLWISPEEGYRGRGYSKILVGLAERYAITSGCMVSELETLEYQAPWLYPKLGYSEQEATKRCVGGFPVYFMYKSLRDNKESRPETFAEETIENLKRSPLFGCFLN